MKALKYTLFILLAGIISAPCLLIFNEQPACESQKWEINLAGFAYAIALAFLCRRYGNKKTQKS
jgi:hypothetical protein